MLTNYKRMDFSTNLCCEMPRFYKILISFIFLIHNDYKSLNIILLFFGQTMACETRQTCVVILFWQILTM